MLFCSWFKSRFQSLRPRDETASVVWFTFCRMPMRYFSKIVSKSCWCRILLYFKHKSQYLINVRFRFFHPFPCIFCSINCSNILSLFACEFFSVLFELCFPRQYSHNLSNYVRRKNIEFLNHSYWKYFWLPVVFETLFLTIEMWFFHERCSSNKIPRNFIEVVRSMTFPLIANIGSFKCCISFFLHLMTVC